MFFTPTPTIALLCLPFLTFASAANYLGIHIQIGEGMAVSSFFDEGMKKKPGAGTSFTWPEDDIGQRISKKYPTFAVYKGDEVAFNMTCEAIPLKFYKDGPRSADYNITSITEGDKVKVRFDVSNADVASLKCTRKVDNTTQVIWTSESAFSAPL